MSVSNQETPEQDIVYDAHKALEFFKQFGKAESVNAGEILFAQGQKSFFSFLHSEKMYLLCEGNVEIKTAAGKPEAIKIGEVFGDHTPITARHFTAVATTPCKFITLSDKQLLTGLQNKPEFALMLMGLFVEFLRRPVSPAEEETVPIQHSKKDGVLSSKMLKELVRRLGDEAMMAVPPQRVIFKEGGSAMLMYVIIEGTVSTRVDNKIVNKSSAGDIIGEIALVDQKPRTASVIAETHCSLLAINRQALLELIQSLPEFGIALLRVLASRSSLHHSAPKSADDWDWD
jgi:CRP-like cAMP-binding protein